MQTMLYYLGISLLFTHEMDAVAHAEWRLLFVLREMSDQAAYPLFLALHVPVFFLFFWLGQNSNYRVRSFFRGGVCLFLVIHAALHFRLSGAAEYSFSGALSNSLIYGAAFCGLVYLATLVRR